MTERSRNLFPSMHFYPDRWLSGRATRMMTPEQKGGFIDLLAHAWDGDEPCTLPDDDALLAQLSGLGAKRWRATGSLIRAQFTSVSERPDLIRNKKQFEVYEAMRALREKRGNSGSTGGSKTQAKHKQNVSKTKASLVPPVPDPSPSPVPDPVDSERETATAGARARRVTPETEGWLRMQVREMRNDPALWELASNDPCEFEQRVRDKTGWSPAEIADITGDEAMRPIEVHA